MNMNSMNMIICIGLFEYHISVYVHADHALLQQTNEIASACICILS